MENTKNFKRFDRAMSKKGRRFDCARLKAVATIGFIISFSFFFDNIGFIISGAQKHLLTFITAER